MKKTLTVILSLAFLFSLSLQTLSQTINSEPPKIKAKTLGGETFDLSAQKGKAVYVVMWATWCGYCAKYLPRIESDIWKKYGADKNFQMVTIAVDDDTETLKKHAAQKGYTFPIIADKDRKIFNSFSVGGVPMSFVINDEGKIVLARAGYSPSGFERVQSIVKQEVANASQTKEPSKNVVPSAKPTKSANRPRSSNRPR